MNKLFPALAGATLLAATPLQADVIGVQIGLSSWTPDYSGTFALDDSSSNGTSIDIESDLGFEDESHGSVWIKIEHPVPLLPNFKIVSTSLDASSSATLGNSSITYGGETFNANANVDTKFDMTHTELTMYYELLDNWINLDAGLSLRQYDGVSRISTSISTAEEDLDFLVPLLYVDARFDLPFTGFFVDTTLNAISVDDNSITETMIGLGYESDFGLGGRVGYRSLELEFDEDDLDVDLEFKGAYVNVFYHF